MTTFLDPQIYRAIVIGNALTLYAKTKIRVNTAYTPTAMMRSASEITGKKFKPRAYVEAAAALREWVMANGEHIK